MFCVHECFTCIQSVYHVVKYYGGHKRALILGNWSYRWFLDAKWVLGTEPGSSKKVLLTMESSFLQLLI